MNPSTRVTLLGPQRLQPTLGPVLESLGQGGVPVATITAGWQEREGEDQELDQHLGGRTCNLRLYERAERAFRHDHDLAAAHRHRQRRLREQQELYAVRLGHAMASLRELDARPGDSDLLVAARAAALAAVRALDAAHLEQARAIHAEFASRWRPAARPAVERERREIEALLAPCAAVAIAGGHVAILANRLRLFGLGELLAGKTVVAWSAGAMCLAERIVLFHDEPPHGTGDPEVLDGGLGLVPGILPLPHARRRLRLDLQDRVAQFARRFVPDLCVPMNEGARLDRRDGRWVGPAANRLGADGRLEPLEVA